MLDRICIPIDSELANVEKVLVTRVSSGIETTDSIARYVIQNGGKRIRPTLFLLSARVAGANPKALPDIAAAIEMLHTASLLHDDVIDDASIRRGKPSAKAKWGNQVSVLVGDLFLCRASEILTEQKKNELMEAAIFAISKTTEGELLEISCQNDADTDEETYMNIISGKTAALFAMAAKAGAIMSDVGMEYKDALMRFGLALGRAFQLSDDALDYTADEEKFGKIAGTDLKEGKLTYPLIAALKAADEKERAIMKDALISGCLNPEKFSEVSTLISKLGGIIATMELAEKFALAAQKELHIFKPSIEKDSLSMLADYAVDRKE